MKTLFTMAALLLAMGCQPAPDFRIDDARIRWLPGDGPMAGYFEFSNQSGQDVQIISATSPAFGRVLLHESVDQDGRMRMQHHDIVTVSAGGSVLFAPGGLHLMLTEALQTIRPGDVLTIELQLEDGTALSADFDVRAPGDV